MAAPERMDRVPRSEAENPKEVVPPPHVQEDRMKLRKAVLDARDSVDRRNIVLIGVSGDADGTLR